MDEQVDGVLRSVDAVTVPVPDLEAGLAFYRDGLGHRLLWRDEETGQAGLALPDSDTEIVLTSRQDYEPDWLVGDVPAAIGLIQAAGGVLVAGPERIPVGRLAVVADPFGNRLVLVDMSAGTYRTDASLHVRRD